ncbi:MAG: hypothetical protein WDN01_02955 [Rhizomicrobium sp.]
MAEMAGLAVKLARQKHTDRFGFLPLINTSSDSAQTIYHLNLHLLGGEQLHSHDWGRQNLSNLS